MNWDGSNRREFTKGKAHEAVGKSVSLTLESFDDHDELVQELLRDTLPENIDMDLWVEAE